MAKLVNLKHIIRDWAVESPIKRLWWLQAEASSAYSRCGVSIAELISLSMKYFGAAGKSDGAVSEVRR